MSFVARINAMDNVSRTMVYGIGVYAVTSFVYGGVKRVSAPKKPVEPAPVAAPMPAPAAPTPTVNVDAAGLQGLGAMDLLKDLDRRLTRVEKALK